MSGALGRSAREIEPASPKTPERQRDCGSPSVGKEQSRAVVVVVEAAAEVVAVAVEARKTAGTGD